MKPAGPTHELATTPVTHDGTLRTVTRGPAAAEPAVGTRLAHFRVEARLGQGGLGVVYRAYDEKLKRAVALKVLLDASATAGANLLDEARAAAAIAHPTIATIHDVQQHEGLVFIVMELVPGTTLRAEMARGPIAPATVMRYARDLAAGLGRAHQSGIVHRDLKPENVMVTPEGSAKILDFGLAAEVPRAPPASGDGRTTGIAGTPAYMAPEQARGERVDARADVFSLGVVLYEALAGRRPFARARTGRPPTSEEWTLVAPLRDAAPGDVPDALADIVERCLAPDRDQRFAAGDQVLAALRAVDPGERTSATGAGARASHPSAALPFWSAPRLAGLAGSALLLTALTITGLRGDRRGTVAPAGSSATSALHDELERAREARRRGDGRAQGMFEEVVHEVERAGAAPSTPEARIAAEAWLSLGDIEEENVVQPPPREPTTESDFGPTVITPATDAAQRTTTRYNEVAKGGAPDLAVCGIVRVGRVNEKLVAIARTAQAREQTAMQQPAVAALSREDRASLDRTWSSSIGAYRMVAAAMYDAATMEARFVNGPATDPVDGTDCRAAAIARRDALAADAGDGMIAAPTPVGSAGALTEGATLEELQAELDRARAARQRGDASARGMLEQLVHDADRSGARASTPEARVAAVATLMLGDLQADGVVAPAARVPLTLEDFGPGVMTAASDAATRATSRYSEAGLWGALDLAVCACLHAGRAWEKVIALAHTAQAAESAAMQRPAIAALYPMDRAFLDSTWSSRVASYRTYALANYDAAVGDARFVSGPTTDPLDGTDCRAEAVARRDALAADAGP